MSKAPFHQPISCWCIAAQLSVEIKNLRIELRKLRNLPARRRFIATCDVIQQLLNRMHQYALTEFYSINDPSFLLVELETQHRFFEPIRKLLHGEIKKIIKALTIQYPEVSHEYIAEWLLYWKEHIPSCLEYVPQAKKLHIWGAMILEQSMLAQDQ